MGLVARDSGRNFSPAPEGLSPAVCCDVVDLGLCDTPWGQKDKVQVVWMLDQTDAETGKPFMVTKRYTLSLSDKANLTQDLETWRGRKFTKEEKQGFDLEKLIGANCQLQIVHNLKDDGKVFANVQAIVPLGKGMTKLRVPGDYVRRKDRTDNNGNGGSHDEHSDTGAGF